jgi:hypothetical protein
MPARRRITDWPLVAHRQPPSASEGGKYAAETGMTAAKRIKIHRHPTALESIPD